MLRSAVTLVALGGIGAVVASHQPTPAPRSPSPVTVHEWGTFTSVAGPDGAAVDWLPLSGPTDLPCFVEHYRNREIVKIFPEDSVGPLDYGRARSALRARVRMETPVVYFYSPTDATVSVNVAFHRGLMTEWYPHATNTQLYVGAGTLRFPDQVANLQWPRVQVSPAARTAFPTEPGESHYYMARRTDATPVAVGPQHERFLFYRGVADFDVPLTATRGTDGSTSIRNLSSSDIPAAVLFERHGSTFGFRTLGRLHPVSNGMTPAAARVAAPEQSGTFDDLRHTLEHMLVAAGLYEKEATAMVDTWRDSWFEEGSRVFYIVPRAVVDSILPLTVTPTPKEVSRVFVGRMEIVTPEMEHAVTTAITANDAAVLAKYGRFLGVIADRLLAASNAPAMREKIRSATDAALASYAKRMSACE